MTVKSISALENVSFKAKQTESKEKTAIKAENSISDGTKKLLLALGALGTVAAASIAIYKGKGFKLSQIDFNNGVASLKNGEKFTGKIKDNLANGDKIVMEYVDGTLKKSARSGSVNVVKVYETVNGEKIISKSVNGATSTHYITRTQQEVKVEQEKLDKLFKDIAISADDFNVETSKIKYKSAKQKQDILNTIQHKKAIEQEVQTRLRNEQVAIDNAKKAQDAYKKPFEDALSNKSAEKSAEVFKDAHRKMAESEALARLEQEKNLARVQENQDFLIEKMLHPTGKSAKESAEVLAIEKTPTQTIIPKFDDNGRVIQREIIKQNGDNIIESLNQNGVVTERNIVKKNGKRVTEYFNEDGVITKREGTRKKGGSFVELFNADGVMSSRRFVDSEGRGLSCRNMDSGIPRYMSIYDRSGVHKVDKKPLKVEYQFRTYKDDPHQVIFFEWHDERDITRMLEKRYMRNNIIRVDFFDRPGIGYEMKKCGLKIYSTDGKKPKLLFRASEDKVVEHFDDYSKITDRWGTVTLRDKKGKIIAEFNNGKLNGTPSGYKPFGPDDPPPPAKMYVPVNLGRHLNPEQQECYLRLCKKFNVEPRESQSAEHFCELVLRWTCPDAYSAIMEFKAKSMNRVREVVRETVEEVVSEPVIEQRAVVYA